MYSLVIFRFAYWLNSTNLINMAKHSEKAQNQVSEQVAEKKSPRRLSISVGNTEGPPTEVLTDQVPRHPKSYILTADTNNPPRWVKIYAWYENRYITGIQIKPEIIYPVGTVVTCRVHEQHRNGKKSFIVTQVEKVKDTSLVSQLYEHLTNDDNLKEEKILALHFSTLAVNLLHSLPLEGGVREWLQETYEVKYPICVMGDIIIFAKE